MRLTFLLLFALCLTLLPHHSTSYADSAGEEEFLPTFTLETPESDMHRSYLGLETAPGEPFDIHDIKTDYLVIELFSMYCPYCQKEAPLVNELYEKMEEMSKKGVRVKIIGLGASNSAFEVDHFRETFNVPFPLFPDKDLSLYKMLRGEGTPGFIGVLYKEMRKPQIILRNSGGFYSAKDFLDELISKGK